MIVVTIIQDFYLYKEMMMMMVMVFCIIPQYTTHENGKNIQVTSVSDSASEVCTQVLFSFHMPYIHILIHIYIHAYICIERAINIFVSLKGYLSLALPPRLP